MVYLKCCLIMIIQRFEMKKFAFIFIILMLPVTVWGHTIGIYGFLSPDFGGGFETQTTFMDKRIVTSLPMTYFGGGFSVFYEPVKYLEFSLGIMGGIGENGDMFISSPVVDAERKSGDFSLSTLNIGAIGKIPFGKEGGLVRTSPLLSLEYNITMGTDIEDEKVAKPMDWNQLWLKFGWELQVNFWVENPVWFIRWGILYGFRLPTKAEKDFVKDTVNEMKHSFNDNFGTIPDFNSRTILGHGINLKMAIGYKF